MRIITTSLILSALWVGNTTWADDDESSRQMPGESPMATTTTEAQEVTRGYLPDEKLSVKPQVGLVAYRDTLGSDTSRLAAGIALDMNAFKLLDYTRWKNVYLGPSTGLLYSHMGSATSNFVGTSPTSDQGGTGANLLIIPTDLKVGYNFGENYRIAAHGGGNIVYRSVANVVNFGDAATADSAWKYYPNAGGSFEVGFGHNVALQLRPDWTFTPADNIFTGTVALGILLS